MCKDQKLNLHSWFSPYTLQEFQYQTWVKRLPWQVLDLTQSFLILFISVKLSTMQETQQASSDKCLTPLFSLHSSYMTSCHLEIQLAAWTVTSVPQSKARYLHCSIVTGSITIFFQMFMVRQWEQDTEELEELQMAQRETDLWTREGTEMKSHWSLAFLFSVS